MTFSEFASAVTRQVFPQGEAANLKAVHKNWIKDSLIELQQRVLCQQKKHLDLFPQNSTFWNCGCTVFPAPRGFIHGLKTILLDSQCTEVRYMPSTRDEIECRVREADSCVACGSSIQEPEPYCGPFFDYGYLLGMRYANASNDQIQRADSGIFALHDDFIWMFPAMRSDEIAMLEWRGIKRDWNDNDVVDFDREASRAVELYLEAESKRKEDCDINGYTTSRATYNDKIGDLIHQCKKERRLPEPAPCFANCDCRVRSTGRAKALPQCVNYFYGADDPNGAIEGTTGDIYVQIVSSDQSFLWIKTTTDGSTGWV